MSILDINDINTELDIEAYYINKIVNFFKKNGYYGDGIGEEYATNSISQRKILKYSYSGKIVASDIFCDISLNFILDNPDRFRLYYTRKLNTNCYQYDICLIVLDSYNAKLVRNFEHAGWHWVMGWEPNGGNSTPVTIKYILNH